MGKLAVWLIGLLLLSLIYAACVHFRVDNIEYDLKDRATIALIKKELNWVRVAVDGRDIIIDGIAPDEDARIHAEQIVKSIWGVRAVENRTALVTSEPDSQSLSTTQAVEETDQTPLQVPEKTLPEPTPEIEPASEVVESAPTEPDNTQQVISCQQQIDNLLTAQRIEFEIASWQIDEESYPLLDELIDWLKTCPDTRIEVGGHTDSIGDEQENISLSLARAESVAHYLQRAGIRGTRLSAVGYGSALPIDTNHTPEGRKRNRRIEIQINRH